MKQSIFTILSKCSNTSAREGVVKTDNGDIHTPVFMPVGTYGAVKTLSYKNLEQISSSIILGNTYHLYIRPGNEIIAKHGGLHKFINWKKPILTDSGGFQVFSLRGKRKISEEGVTFQSHLDGSSHLFTPESVVETQRILGSDFMMMLDVCPPGDADFKTWEKALNITTRWAKRGMDHFNKTKDLYGHSQVLVPIIQGGTNKDLRIKSANELLALDSPLYAIGGLAVGEPKEEMLNSIEVVNDIIPKEKPRYLMGVGTPTDLVQAVARGVDMFDCVMPSRNARNGQLFTRNGKVNIRNSKYKNDTNPIDIESKSDLSLNYSKGYLHHLFKIEEMLGYTIATLHNLSFYLDLMSKIRSQINNGTFSYWSKEFISNYEGK
ncbi:MAG: tRNA guanosine(34) transglycosylase Tgt [bacterium TMED198]|nr:MAG: tRNA guanosine(34) transglycosylase Tgt [bacterium TMED198]